MGYGMGDVRFLRAKIPLIRIPFTSSILLPRPFVEEDRVGLVLSGLANVLRCSAARGGPR